MAEYIEDYTQACMAYAAMVHTGNQAMAAQYAGWAAQSARELAAYIGGLQMLPYDEAWVARASEWSAIALRHLGQSAMTTVIARSI